MVDDAPPNAVSGKRVLLGFLLLLACVAAAIVYIMNDLERKSAKARALEERLGRQVGPEDSPKAHAKLKAAE